MRVLYIDNERDVASAQRGLLDVLDALPAGIIPSVLCPEGELAAAVRRAGVPVHRMPGTSRRPHLRPGRTVVAGAEVAVSALVLRRIAAATGADVVHANSARAGLMAVTAEGLGGPPVVVTVHGQLPGSRSGALVKSAVSRRASVVTANSLFTARDFPLAQPRILHQPLDVDTFDPTKLDRSQAREALGLPPGGVLVGVVGQITPWKGQDVAIRALKLVRDRHPDARLLLVGRTRHDKAARHDNSSYGRWLYRLVRGLGLQESVEFWDEREDVTTVMRALDVALFPSWGEPFGLAVVEAMALETAVIATDAGGPVEYIRHGVDGLLLPPHDVSRWAVALDRLLADAALRQSLAVSGSRAVRERFDRSRYASQLVQIYHEVAA